jgi:hypothetical protein
VLIVDCDQFKPAKHRHYRSAGPDYENARRVSASVNMHRQLDGERRRVFREDDSTGTLRPREDV